MPRLLIFLLLGLGLAGFGMSLETRDVGGLLFSLYLLIKYGWIYYYSETRRNMGRKR